ncbi:MYND Zn-finger protein [Ceratobasidium sp. AG-Ba]|nr:MYND Zn-finger protein [Ceratobasidium sp. AG-Ba]
MSSSTKSKPCVICAYPAASRCSGCEKAFYCSKEHQKSAWSKHKRLCKIYQAAKKGEPVPPADSYCGLCGKSDIPLKKTDCCNRTVCDDYHNYQLFSYSKDSCARNHDRYTRCCYHYNEQHGGDAYSCAQCSSSHEAETETWYMTNHFNFQEDIERANPPSFVPTKCSKCGREMKLNVEGYTHGPNGKECQRCMAGLMGRYSPENTYMMDGNVF